MLFNYFAFFFIFICSIEFFLLKLYTIVRVQIRCDQLSESSMSNVRCLTIFLTFWCLLYRVKIVSLLCFHCIVSMRCVYIVYIMAFAMLTIYSYSKLCLYCIPSLQLCVEIVSIADIALLIITCQHRVYGI